MISVSIKSDAASAREFMVQVTGQIRNPKALNVELGKRLERELKGHFLERNKEPNKMGAQKTDFWAKIRASTKMTEATDTGATVTIAEDRYRIHLFGGKIVPTGGRKFLTIPLIKEARARPGFTGRVEDYEKQTGNKLFRLPFGRVLFEHSDKGDRSFPGRQKATVRGLGKNFNSISIRERSQVRPVYALKESVTIKQDPRALPEPAKLLNALQDTADKWAARLNRKTTIPTA